MRVALQLAISFALATALAGLWARRRVGQCWSFVPYAVAIIICGNLATLWPARFFNPEFWLLKQAIYDACKLAIALELTWRVLGSFPGAARAIRPWVLLLIGASTVFAVVGPPRTYAGIAEWQPRVLLGITWMFALTSVACLWYRLPIRLWHRSLLIGFSVYMVTFVALLQLLRVYGWSVAPWVGLADGGAVLLMTWCWAIVAWQPEPVPDDIPAMVLQRLGMEEAR